MQAQSDEAPLVITEVLVNGGQRARDASFEWVELQSRSDRTLSLAGWTLEDNHGADPLPALNLSPGQFLLVIANADVAAVFPGGRPDGSALTVIEDGRIGNGLANTGDRLQLRDPAGNAADALSWGDDRTFTDLPAPAAGQTLGLDAGTQQFRPGDPTPGAALPSLPALRDEPAPLRISEIFANAGRGGADAAFEWVEIFNPLNEPVDLTGWRLADNVGSDLLPGGSVPAQGYTVIAATAEAVPEALNVVIVADGRLGNGLANSGDLVSLLDPAGREVDVVDYSRPPVPLPERGRSIALRLESPGESGNGWVVNAEPSPGRGAVRPVLSGAIDPIADQGTSPSVIREGGDAGGFPVWGLVALALGIPVLTIGGQYVWKRRWALVPR